MYELHKNSKAIKLNVMKNIIYILLFLLLSSSAFQANSQNVVLIPGNSNDQKVTHIKAFKSKYVNGTVYMHITISGNTETNILVIERSLDATNFEVIGYINIIGVTIKDDIAYYFTDKSPVIANLYYRLKCYSSLNEPVYSETIGVIPIDEYKTPADITTIASSAPISNEQINCLSDPNEPTKCLSGAVE